MQRIHQTYPNTFEEEIDGSFWVELSERFVGKIGILVVSMSMQQTNKFETCR